MARTLPGYTLAELIVVMAVIGALAVVFIAIDPGKYIYRAKEASATKMLSDIGGAIKMFYVDNGRYPNDTDGCVLTDELKNYLRGGQFPISPIGGCFDFDNWSHFGAWDGSEPPVQVTLRSVPDVLKHKQPMMGSGATWNYFYVLKGRGYPHTGGPTDAGCNLAGECVNCPDYTIWRPVNSAACPAWASFCAGKGPQCTDDL